MGMAGRWWRIMLATALVTLSQAALAHPDDEFCMDGGMDPELCSALVELDRAEPGPSVQGYPLDRRSGWQTAWRYTEIGIRHIVPGGTDHLLFVGALLLGAFGLRVLVWLITAFTVAHGLALVAAVTGWVSLPSQWVEAAIAATIAWVGIENLVWRAPVAWRYALVFVFGLIHGLGFAGFIQELGLPEQQLAPALLGFNVGVEIGQIAVVGLLGGAAWLLLGRLREAPRATALRWIRRLGSVAIAAVGALWFVERLAA